MERINLGKVVPEKGVDYFTEEDIAAMIAEIEADIDLTDYVKNTDYASDAKAGVVKTNSSYFGAQVSDTTGVLFGNPVTYQEYGSKPTQFFISKGTLDNVLAAQIGDIESILEELDIRRWSISEYKI